MLETEARPPGVERSFYNGRTRRVEVELRREVRHCELESRTWVEEHWIVWDIDCKNWCEDHASHVAAELDYERRVAERIRVTSGTTLMPYQQHSATFRCGHVGSVRLPGWASGLERAKALANATQRDCPECRKAKKGTVDGERTTGDDRGSATDCSRPT